MKKRPAYGGQAVIEGVMMGGPQTTVTAVRKEDGNIAFYEVRRTKRPWLSKLKKVPFLRGLAGILESSAIGTKHLNYSSDIYENPEMENEEPKKESQNKTGMILGVAAIGILSFLFAQIIFKGLPAFLAHLTTPIFPGKTVQIMIEGAIKATLLLGYIYLISLTPIIKRVFQYHGAEHKVINTYESGQDLTVENVKHQSRLHYRCGSSFILFSLVVSIILYFFVPYEPLWLREVTRIALIPVDLAIAYEVLQGTNKLRNIPILKWLGYPGHWLQYLTTKEPDDAQIEVAILAFKEMQKREADYTGKGVETAV